MGVAEWKSRGQRINRITVEGRDRWGGQEVHLEHHGRDGHTRWLLVGSTRGLESCPCPPGEFVESICKPEAWRKFLFLVFSFFLL